jgi:hypothetical protein
LRRTFAKLTLVTHPCKLFCQTNLLSVHHLPPSN